MKRKLAIIHTTPVTVEPLKSLAVEALSNLDVINFVDDSILPELLNNGADISTVTERLVTYAKFAETAGADVILNACSSVGEVVAKMREQVSVPIVRIDEAMAEKAVSQGRIIAVAATLPTTLEPTLRLLKTKAEEVDKEIEFRPVLAEAAYQKLIAGDRDGHDSVLAATLEEVAREVDVVVLAQASMARVVATLPEGLQEKFLTSPELGMSRVKSVLEGTVD